MGHLRLGRLQRTKTWQQVIALLNTNADTEAIAAKSMTASEKGLQQAANDPTFIYSYWLLTQIPLASRENNFADALKRLGLIVTANPGLFDVIGAFTDAVDKYNNTTQRRSDLGEMAQMAAVESISELVSQRSTTLFGTTPEDVQNAFRFFSDSSKFSYMGHEFLSRFTERYLNYYLSRELSNHIGPGERFNSITDHELFNQAFRLHCKETTRQVFNNDLLCCKGNAKYCIGNIRYFLFLFLNAAPGNHCRRSSNTNNRIFTL